MRQLIGLIIASEQPETEPQLRFRRPPLGAAETIHVDIDVDVCDRSVVRLAALLILEAATGLALRNK